MNQQVKSALAVSFLVIGLLWGTNAVVAEDPQASWFGWSLLFLALAGAFWFWIYREQRSAAEDAETSIEDTEAFQRELDVTAQAALDAQVAANERVDDALEDVGVEPAEEDEAAEMVDQDEVFAENATPQDAKPVEVEVEEESVAERAAETRPSDDEVIEAAKSGDKVAETEVADAEAAPPVVETDVEISDTDDDSDVPDTDTSSTDRGVNESPVSGLTVDRDTDSSDSESDDLTLIEGIGPRYQELLIAGGIDSYAKLASLTASDIEDLVQAQGGRRSASMDTWAEQAKLAAAGDWDGLRTLQSSFSAGRRDE